ncbi:hypothetical protein [Nocardioides dongkuii]|uniref:hypothetical protein n=1 Tax=Nocardioides dongkuii TaxID=2760089 RepID=UPI0015FBAB4C|nr:hypothetical protein [Nocardioides dongkuii]
MIGRRRRERRLRELAELDAFRHVRRAADEDVTRFGEELTALHVDTLTTELDGRTLDDYQRALDAYESAKATLRRCATAADVTEVTRALADGRFSQACVLAHRDGRDRPERRPPCFFDPGHGPATRDMEWAPPGGVPREVPVCFRDAERLDAGDRPDVRLVRLGDRRVAWFASGPLYTAWAAGWYDELIRSGRADATRITMAYAGPVGPDSSRVTLGVAWSDPGSWTEGGMIGGHDYSGQVGGGDGGFGDGGAGGGGGDG